MTNPSPYGTASISTLERQTASLLTEFEAFGAERIEPAIVQPADAFLDRMGEELRSRTYVFTGPDGTELCLRPDLTIPAAQAYLAHTPLCDRSVKLCYAGPVFRHDPSASDRPGQSLQAGVECFNAPNTPEVDSDVLWLTHKALLSAGLSKAAITVGDVGLFRSLLNALNLPPHWISKIRRNAWHEDRLAKLLDRLGKGAAEENQFVASLKEHSPEQARTVLRDALGLGGISIIGTRTFDEIADRFLERAAESAAARLSPKAANAIKSFVSMKSSADKVVASLTALCREASVNIEKPIADFTNRTSLLASRGLDLGELEFAGQFGRNMEYYTGFVFEFRADGIAAPVAGGGRYDDLLSALGAPMRTPSIGLAIFCDRLAAAVAGSGAGA